MTRKRFKFGLAVLGILGIFFMALLALVFAPSLASAGKSTGLGHHSDGDSQSSHHNPAYFALYDGPQNGSDHHGGHDPGNGDYCARNHCDAGGNPADGSDHEGNLQGQDGPFGGNGQSGANAQGGQGGGSGNDQGGGQGPYAAGGSGGPGGYFAPGAPGGDANSCQESENSCDKDAGGQNSGQNSQGDQGANGDGSQNSDGTDNHQDGSPNGPSGNGGDPQSGPNTFAITDTTGGGPTGDNPPATVLTDAPVQVPEPFTLSLFAVGLAGAAMIRRRSA